MRTAPALLALLLCAGTAGAQVYKWKDDKGVTHYSDQPPPPSAPARSKVEVKSFGGGGTLDLPPLLADAVRNNPVTLYTTGQCQGCDSGRAMLIARGIPFQEKTVNTPDDQAAFKQAGGANQLPLLKVGRNKMAGYEQAGWKNLLDAAGYPQDKILPRNYQYSAAVPAAPPPPPPPAQQEDTPRRPPPPANAPPDFQF